MRSIAFRLGGAVAFSFLLSTVPGQAQTAPPDPHAGHDMGPDGLQRRFLLLPGLRSSRITVFDTYPDPRSPRLHKVIEPEEVGVVLLAGEWQALFRENSAQRFPMLLLVVRDHSVEVEQHRFDHAPSSIIPRRPVRFVEQFHGVTRPGGQPGGGKPGSELHDATGIAGCDDMRRRGAQRLDLGRQHGA